jgi:ubiquinone/menaquinone biosynthesis C-methylase UbiE
VIYVPIKFHSPHNRNSYTTREADVSWSTAIRELIDVRGKNVLDIGCGGGIYSRALAEMGAAQVTGVDFSEEMLLGATAYCEDYDQINFVIGNALQTNLENNTYDVILKRALIHHIDNRNDLEKSFAEAFRLLKVGGTLVVQDRTPEDCLLPGSKKHIRGYFLSYFPLLAEKEVARRHSSEVVQNALLHAGFQQIDERKLWETRRTYKNANDLQEDLLARKGRSILHELVDGEVKELANHIQKHLEGSTEKEIIEQDRWTIWCALRLA